MAATFFQAASWITAGTANAGQGNSTYKDVSVTGAAVGDLLIAFGAVEGVNVGGASVRSIITQSGTTSSWTLSQPAVVDSADVDVIGGFATVSTAGTIVVRVQVRADATSNHMGAGVLLVPAADWSGTPTWQGTSGNGFVGSATGRLNYTPSANALVFYGGSDWNAANITSNAGTPATPNYAVRAFDTGTYSVWSGWWTAQTASARDYGPSALTGRDMSGVVLNVPASSGTSYTASPSEAVGITDSASRVVAADRSATDGVGVTDSASRIVDAGRSATDGVGVTDVADRTVAAPRDGNDGVGLGDNLSTVLSAVREPADSVGITDSLDVVLTPADVEYSEWSPVDITIGDEIAVDPADPVGITDSVSAVLGVSISPADPVGITDDASRTLSAERAQDDAVGISDSVNAELTGPDIEYSEWSPIDISIGDALEANPADPVGIADSVSVSLGHHYDISISDGVGVEDTGSDQVSVLNFDQADAEGISDIVSTLRAMAAQPIDAVNVTDVITTLLTRARAVSDPVGITDSVTVELISNGGVSIGNDVGLTDEVTVSVIRERSISDGVGIADAVAAGREMTVLIQDAVGVTDQVSIAGIIVIPTVPMTRSVQIENGLRSISMENAVRIVSLIARR